MKESKEEFKKRLQSENELMAKYAIQNQCIELKVGMIFTQTCTNDKYEVLELNIAPKCDCNGYVVGYEKSEIYFKKRLVEKGISIYSKQNRRDFIGQIGYYPYDGIKSGSIHFN